jgi:hypothetical protein
MIAADSASIKGKEEGTIVRFKHEKRSDLSQIFVDPMECSISNGYDAVLPAFSLTDEDGPIVKIHIVEL